MVVADTSWSTLASLFMLTAVLTTLLKVVGDKDTPVLDSLDGAQAQAKTKAHAFAPILQKTAALASKTHIPPPSLQKKIVLTSWAAVKGKLVQLAQVGPLDDADAPGYATANKSNGTALLQSPGKVGRKISSQLHPLLGKTSVVKTFNSMELVLSGEVHFFSSATAPTTQAKPSSQRQMVAKKKVAIHRKDEKVRLEAEKARLAAKKALLQAEKTRSEDTFLNAEACRVKEERRMFAAIGGIGSAKGTSVSITVSMLALVLLGALVFAPMGTILDGGAAIGGSALEQPARPTAYPTANPASYPTVHPTTYSTPYPAYTAVGCTVSAFESSWGGCTEKCGGGVQLKTCSVITAASFGGSACPMLEIRQACNVHPCTDPCAVDFAASESFWSSCTKPSCRTDIRHLAISSLSLRRSYGAICSQSLCGYSVPSHLLESLAIGNTFRANLEKIEKIEKMENRKTYAREVAAGEGFPPNLGPLLVMEAKISVSRPSALKMVTSDSQLVSVNGKHWYTETGDVDKVNKVVDGCAVIGGNIVHKTEDAATAPGYAALDKSKSNGVVVLHPRQHTSAEAVNAIASMVFSGSAVHIRAGSVVNDDAAGLAPKSAGREASANGTEAGKRPQMQAKKLAMSKTNASAKNTKARAKKAKADEAKYLRDRMRNVAEEHNVAEERNVLSLLLVASANTAKVPPEARTLVEVHHQAQLSFCVPDSVASNVLPADIVNTPVTAVDGQLHSSLGAYLRSRCDENGDVSIKTLGDALCYKGSSVSLASMPSGFYDLPPMERVSDVVHADGAFVVRIGKHAVGIRDGIVFDNDLRFGAAINARAVADPVALFATIGLGGGISQARRVVVGAIAKDLLTCVEMMDGEEDSPTEEDSPAGSRSTMKNIALLSLCSFMGNVGVSLTGFGMAIVYLFVWQIAVLAGYEGSLKFAVFVQAIALFSAQVGLRLADLLHATYLYLPCLHSPRCLFSFGMQPLLLYKAKVRQNASSKLLQYFIPITILATPLGQITSKHISTELVEAIAGVLVTFVSVREMYNKRKLYESWFCGCATKRMRITNTQSKAVISRMRLGLLMLKPKEVELYILGAVRS
jgi:hypothetical protein